MQTQVQFAVSPTYGGSRARATILRTPLPARTPAEHAPLSPVVRDVAATQTNAHPAVRRGGGARSAGAAPRV